MWELVGSELYVEMQQIQPWKPILGLPVTSFSSLGWYCWRNYSTMGRNLKRKRDSFLDKTTVLYLKVSFAEILKPSPCLPVWRLARTQKPSFESSTAWDRGALLQSWCSIWAGLKAARDPRRKEGTQVVGSVHCSWKEAVWFVCWIISQPWPLLLHSLQSPHGRRGWAQSSPWGWDRQVPSEGLCFQHKHVGKHVPKYVSRPRIY